jgi:uncharacterized protein DUF5677
MNHEDSLLLKVFVTEANKIIAEGGAVSSFSDLMYECIRDAASHWPKHQWRAVANTDLRLRKRVEHAQKTRRHILKRYADAFRTFDRALASAEFVNRRLVWAYFGRGESASDTPLFNMQDTVGGRTAKLLVIIGLHARMIRIGTEISLLLRSGFPEGASARSRTLYELVIKALVILSDSSESGCDLAERYYVSSVYETYRNGPYPDEEIARIVDEARRRWGSNFFTGEHNWARPLLNVPPTKRIAFKDLEEVTQAEIIHHMYLEGNDAIHAGARRAINEADFRRSYLYNTRNDVDIDSTGQLGQYAAFYLQVGIYEISRQVATDTKQWDEMLSIGEFVTQIELTQFLFGESLDDNP